MISYGWYGFTQLEYGIDRSTTSHCGVGIVLWAPGMEPVVWGEPSASAGSFDRTLCLLSAAIA